MAEFGLSAVNHASGPIRKAGERLLLRLYEINPKSVRKIMPPENDQNRKNMNYKNLYDDFKSLDSAQNGPQDLDKSIKHWSCWFKKKMKEWAKTIKYLDGVC